MKTIDQSAEVLPDPGEPAEPAGWQRGPARFGETEVARCAARQPGFYLMILRARVAHIQKRRRPRASTP